LTRKGSEVQILYRPPQHRRSQPLVLCVPAPGAAPSPRKVRGLAGSTRWDTYDDASSRAAERRTWLVVSVRWTHCRGSAGLGVRLGLVAETSASWRWRALLTKCCRPDVGRSISRKRCQVSLGLLGNDGLRAGARGPWHGRVAMTTQRASTPTMRAIRGAVCLDVLVSGLCALAHSSLVVGRCNVRRQPTLGDAS
jgi:hypothetical protein